MFLMFVWFAIYLIYIKHFTVYFSNSVYIENSDITFTTIYAQI